MFAGKVMAVFYFLFEVFLSYITTMASNKYKMTNTNTFCLISISNLKTGRFETIRFETWRFVILTFCKPDVLKPDVLKPDVLKPDVLKPDVLWVYPIGTPFELETFVKKLEMKVNSFKMQTELEYDKDSYVPTNSIQLMSHSGVACFSYHWHAWPNSGLCMYKPKVFTESLFMAYWVQHVPI